MLTHLKRSAFAAAAVCAVVLAAERAHATAHVFDFHLLSAAPVNTNLNANIGSFSPGPPATVILLGTGRVRVWALGGFAPFNVFAGDTIEATITFDDGPLTLEASAYSDLQSLSFSFSNGIPSPTHTVTVSRSATISGTTGDFAGDPPTVTSTVNSASQLVPGGGTGFTNLTSSSMTFTSVHFFTEIHAISPQDAPFTFASFGVLDQFIPAPAPGALALLGLGLLGFGYVRRRRA